MTDSRHPLASLLGFDLYNALMGMYTTLGVWPIRPNESLAERLKLIEFLGTSSAKKNLPIFLAEQGVPRNLANLLLKRFGISRS